MLFSRTHFFLFSLAITAAYGFYIITTDDGGFPGSELLGGQGGGVPISDGYVPELAVPEGVMVFQDDDEDYMDRVERLQHALRTKRDVIALADAYSQNIRPMDLDGMRLVREPVIEFDDEYDDGHDDEDDVIPSRLTKRSAAGSPSTQRGIPISFVIID
uniref:Secreted protein n=1 Tax=Panagrolaimus sp. PS1159 TaxID=55785 RepID=A0AC35FST0_9BILA